MTGTLLIRLDAPLQSWGSSPSGAIRPTNTEPTLSGMVGLIANAMGRDFADDVSDLAALPMGVRTERAGVLTEDFYTAGAVTGVGARQETRTPEGGRHFRNVRARDSVAGTKHYLSGAVFRVGLECEEPIARAIMNALERPARILFLGRKSCPADFGPTAAGQPRMSYVHAPLEQALREAPLDADLVPVEGNKPRRGRHADPTLSLTLPCTPTEPGARQVFDVPLSFSTKRRRYAARCVRRVVIDPQEIR